MITASPHPRQRQSASWQQEMATAITQPEALIATLALDPALIGPARLAAAAFGLRVPLSYVSRMRRGDPADPLLRQVLPLGDELNQPAAYVADPLDEQAAMRAPGLLQKYRGRALLITTSACAVHCRYCFRREFPYSESVADAPRWSEAISAVAADNSIEEIILSGGDPLSLSNGRLASLTNALAQIPHLRRFRVHTRQPIVLPSRVDEGLLAWIKSLPWPTVFVLHANHPNEIDQTIQFACARLSLAGAKLLNQSVLLRGVNDDPAILTELSKKLFDVGVLPYYLHVLDPVRGAAHFDIPELRAREIAADLTIRLPGFLVPRLVREVAGAPAKVPLALRLTM